MGGKMIQRDFEASAGRTFEAARRAVANLGYSVLQSDAVGLVLSFNTGRSMWSYGGQDLTATVSSGGSGSRVVVGGSLAVVEFAVNTETFNQRFSWGEKGRVSNKFLDEIAALVTSPPDRSPSRDGVGEHAVPEEE
jgi:hypothetical protein